MIAGEATSNNYLGIRNIRQATTSLTEQSRHKESTGHGLQKLLLLLDRIVLDDTLLLSRGAVVPE